MSTTLLILIVLACPLLMWLMMRGGHGHGHAGHDHTEHGHSGEPASLDELRHRRNELDRQIAARERR